MTIDELYDKMQSDMHDLEIRLQERIEKVETNLLKAFHSWARPTEIKLRHIGDLDERVSLMEERVSELERRGK